MVHLWIVAGNSNPNALQVKCRSISLYSSSEPHPLSLLQPMNFFVCSFFHPQPCSLHEWCHLITEYLPRPMCLNTGLQLVLLFGKVVEETGGEAPMLEAGLGVLESGLNSYLSLFPDCRCNVSSCAPAPDARQTLSGWDDPLRR